MKIDARTIAMDLDEREEIMRRYDECGFAPFSSPSINSGWHEISASYFHINVPTAKAQLMGLIDALEMLGYFSATSITICGEMCL